MSQHGFGSGSRTGGFTMGGGAKLGFARSGFGMGSGNRIQRGVTMGGGC